MNFFLLLCSFQKKLAKSHLIAYNSGHGDIAQLGEHLLDV